MVESWLSRPHCNSGGARPVCRVWRCRAVPPAGPREGTPVPTRGGVLRDGEGCLGGSFREDLRLLIVCRKCGGEMKIISVILEHKVITKVLGHLAGKGITPGRDPPDGSRPSQSNLSIRVVEP